MKTLKNYINESISKHDFDKFAECALSALDYYYNEGLEVYNDDNLKAYVNGDKEPNYKEVIDITIGEFKKFIPSNILSEIKKYPKTSYKEDFELAILNAMDRIIHPNR